MGALLSDQQRIHVGAQADGPSPVAGAQNTDDTSVPTHPESKNVKNSRHSVFGLRFPKTQFRGLVKLPS